MDCFHSCFALLVTLSAKEARDHRECRDRLELWHSVTCTFDCKEGEVVGWWRVAPTLIVRNALLQTIDGGVESAAIIDAPKVIELAKRVQTTNVAT